MGVLVFDFAPESHAQHTRVLRAIETELQRAITTHIDSVQVPRVPCEINCETPRFSCKLCGMSCCCCAELPTLAAGPSQPQVASVYGCTGAVHGASAAVCGRKDAVDGCNAARFGCAEAVYGCKDAVNVGVS
eukprot:406523-Rhodomonas_salina.1